MSSIVDARMRHMVQDGDAARQDIKQLLDLVRLSRTKQEAVTSLSSHDRQGLAVAAAGRGGAR